MADQPAALQAPSEQELHSSIENLKLEAEQLIVKDQETYKLGANIAVTVRMMYFSPTL